MAYGEGHPHLISLLGPTVVRKASGHLSFRASLRRSLIELLAIHAQEVVTIGVIVDELWSGAPPEQPEEAVQAHIRRLRMKLSSSKTDGNALPIHAVGGGYLLDIPPSAVDALHMVSLVNDATAVSTRHAEHMVACLDLALSLWRGEPFGGVFDGSHHRAAAQYWTEVHSLALRSWAAANLQTGRPQVVITHLHPHALADPVDEGLNALLISALHQAGRKVEAMEVYRSLRDRLVDGYGVEPSTQVQDIYQRILLDEGDIDAGRLAARARHGRRPTPRLNAT